LRVHADLPEAMDSFAIGEFLLFATSIVSVISMLPVQATC